MKELLLSPRAVSAPPLRPVLGCAVAVAEGGLCWLGGKGEEPVVLCCVWAALTSEALTQTRLPKTSGQ